MICKMFLNINGWFHLNQLEYCCMFMSNFLNTISPVNLQEYSSVFYQQR